MRLEERKFRRQGSWNSLYQWVPTGTDGTPNVGNGRRRV